MTRPLAMLALYVVLGTAFTLLVYWLVLGGTFAAADQRFVDDFAMFVIIALNTALAFAATGVIAAVMARSQTPFIPVLVASAVAAGVIGLLISLWFAGVGLSFPLVMALGGGICALTAKVAGYFAPPPARKER